MIAQIDDWEKLPYVPALVLEIYCWHVAVPTRILPGVKAVAKCWSFLFLSKISK